MSKKWSQEQQALFLQRTGELLSRGYSLAEAIESLAFYFPDNKKTAIQSCILQLSEGYPLHQILTKLHFNKSLVGYVYFAEQHGGLAEAIQEGSTFILKRNQDVKRMIKMFNYPAVLMVITAILFYFVQQVLLPRFHSIFASMNLKPNVFTSFITLFSEFVPLLLFSFLVIFLILLMYYLIRFRHLSPLEKRCQVVKIPIIGSLTKSWFTHYFSIQMSYLLSGGLSVLEALTMFENNLEQPFYGQVCNEVRRKLSTGDRLDTIVSTFTVFEKELAHIIKHGQDSGKLAQELSFYSKHCVVMLEGQIEKKLKIIQPLLYLLIGFTIVSMYLAILLPMFHMLDGL
ncbi:competence type IV pilus assembly protein ComGB [Neobacillus sp. LXY-4]|uniref:competence type IV pilus assembly protein ComGB n=1 Tax=Neobacillus sp. LXY-4 TaxID=3379826 RepID=UPI003EE3E851